MEIISRAEWGARAPKRVHRIPTPTPRLWLHHSADNARGAAGIRQIQRFHMDVRGWADIAYSFLIDPYSLEVFEGRGAGVAGGHTAGDNTTSHAICALGNFEELRPRPELLDRIAELVAHGHRAGWWPAQLTGGHRQAPGASTACPGWWLQQHIPGINNRAANPPKETPMPIPSTHTPTWSLLDLNDTVAEADSLLALYLGEDRGEALTSWGRDIATKLRKREDPRPTLDFIEWALANPAEAAKL